MKKRIRNSGWSLCLTLAVVAAAPASAHHSGAGYDMTKTYTAAQATLKEFRWGAPHSAAVFVIKDKDGKPQELTLATTSPGMLTRQGFKPKDFKAGDKVDIAWHPSKNGNLAGTLSSIKLPDGRILKDAEFEGARNGDNEAKQVE